MFRVSPVFLFPGIFLHTSVCRLVYGLDLAVPLRKKEDNCYKLCDFLCYVSSLPDVSCGKHIGIGNDPVGIPYDTAFGKRSAFLGAFLAPPGWGVRQILKNVTLFHSFLSGTDVWHGRIAPFGYGNVFAPLLMYGLFWL
jgi:hypothetical protein